MKMPSILSLCVLSTWMLLSAQGQSAILVNFNTDGDLANNFRYVFNGNSVTSHSGADGYAINTSGNGTTNGDIFAYDTTPGDAASKTLFSGDVTVTMRISAANAGASFGFFIINPTETGTQPLALFNWDNGTSPNTTYDQIRIFTSANIVDVGVGSLATGGNVSGSSGINADGGFSTITFSYKNIGGNGHMSLSMGSLSVTDVSLSTAFLSSYQIGIRVFDPYSDTIPGGTKFDDFTVNIDPIPEPSGMALLALPFAGLILGRRREGGF